MDEDNEPLPPASVHDAGQRSIGVAGGGEVAGETRPLRLGAGRMAVGMETAREGAECAPQLGVGVVVRKGLRAEGVKRVECQEPDTGQPAGSAGLLWRSGLNGA